MGDKSFSTGIIRLDDEASWRDVTVHEVTWLGAAVRRGGVPDISDDEGGTGDMGI